jgi:hypothetical protein
MTNYHRYSNPKYLERDMEKSGVEQKLGYILDQRYYSTKLDLLTTAIPGIRKEKYTSLIIRLIMTTYGQR